MATVHIFNTLPRHYSIPYQEIIPEQGTAFSATQYVQFLPGVNLDLDLEIWEKIKVHPDVKVFLDRQYLIPTNTVNLDKMEEIGGVQSVIGGQLEKTVQEPVPIGQPKLNTALPTQIFPSQEQIEKEKEKEKEK